MGPKVLLINDSTTNPNWGDRAASISLQEMILASGAEIPYRITESGLFTSRLFEDSAHLEKPGKNRTRELIRAMLPPVFLQARRQVLARTKLSHTRGPVPESWESFGPCAQRVLGDKSPWPDLARAVDEIDVAVVHGDGAMVGNGIHPRSLLFLAYLIRSHFGKPVIIVNHTADFDHPLLRQAAENVYPLFDDVAFRDSISVERCRTICHGRFVPDSAFWFDPLPSENWGTFAKRPTYLDIWPDTARFDPTEPYLCLGGSSLFSTSRQTAELTEQYTSLITHIASIYSGQIVLTVSDLTDQGVFRSLAQALELPLVALTTPVQQAVDILGAADAYIGGRWHPSIFALRGGTPVIALSGKTFKMQALTQMAGLSAETYDALHIAQARHAIAAALLRLLDEGADLRTRIREWAVQMARDSWGNVAYLQRDGTSRLSSSRE